MSRNCELMSSESAVLSGVQRHQTNLEDRYNEVLRVVADLKGQVESLNNTVINERERHVSEIDQLRCNFDQYYDDVKSVTDERHSRLVDAIEECISGLDSEQATFRQTFEATKTKDQVLDELSPGERAALMVGTLRVIGSPVDNRAWSVSR